MQVQLQEQSKKEDSETADGVLVQQALAGDQEAFEALVYRYKSSLLQLIYHYVGESDEAHDVLQQVWLKLYLSPGTLNVGGLIKLWLLTVARNCCIDTLRRRRLIYFSEVETVKEEEVSSLDALPDMHPSPHKNSAF